LDFKPQEMGEEFVIKVSSTKKAEASDSGLFGSRTLGSLLLLIGTPVFVSFFWYIAYFHHGSFSAASEELLESGFEKFFTVFWQLPFDPYAWKLLFAYMAFELLLMIVVPGKEFRANTTRTGHVPVYKANGVQCYSITVVALFACLYFGILDLDAVYDKMGSLLLCSSLTASCLCVFLTWKGLNFPSTKDCGSNGNIIIDYYWGTELYPRVFGIDIKQFTNCRFGMMFWQVGIICYAAKQYSMLGYVSSSMVASVLLQSVYVCKFFIWETGYYNSMDIQHDRGGYYLCWGCMVWLPCMYTIHTYFLVMHPVLLSVPTFSLIVFSGLFCTWWNYDCDRQRQMFRASNGQLMIWGKKPKYIIAKYLDHENKVRSSMLLVSGWWRLARHFHYVPEVLAAFFWCAPALFTHPFPYFYPIYLAILLLDRAWRDDDRCRCKYGEYWDAYCALVPFKVFPGAL